MKLKMIFDLLKENVNFISINGILTVLETFYEETIKNFEIKKVSKNDFLIILENYKCIKSELIIKNVNSISLEELKEIFYKEKIRLKIATIFLLDNFNKSNFTLKEFEIFLTTLENDFLYSSLETALKGNTEQNKNMVPITKEEGNKKERKTTILTRPKQKTEILDLNILKEVPEEMENLCEKKIETSSNIRKLIKNHLDNIIIMGAFKNEQTAKVLNLKKEMIEKINLELDCYEENSEEEKKLILSLKKKIEIYELQIKEVFNSLEQNEDKIAYLNDELLRYKDLYFKERKERHDDLINYENEQNEKMSKIQLLNKENFNLLKKYEDLKIEKNYIDTMNVELNELLKIKESNLKKLETEKSSSENIVNMSFLKNEDLNKNLEKISKEYFEKQSAFEKELFVLKQENSKLTKEIVDLKNKNLSYKKHTIIDKEKFSIRESLFNNSILVGDSILSMTNCQQEDHSDSDIEEIKKGEKNDKNKNDFKKEINLEKTENFESKEFLLALEKKDQRIDYLLEELKILQEKNKEVEEENTKFEKRLDDMKKTVNESHVQIDDYKDHLTKLIKKNYYLKKTLNQSCLVEDIEESEVYFPNFQKKEIELNELKKKIDIYEESIKQKDEQIKEFKIDKNFEEKKIEELEKKLKDQNEIIKKIEKDDILSKKFEIENLIEKNKNLEKEKNDVQKKLEKFKENNWNLLQKLKYLKNEISSVKSILKNFISEKNQLLFEFIKENIIYLKKFIIQKKNFIYNLEEENEKQFNDFELIEKEKKEIKKQLQITLKEIENLKEKKIKKKNFINELEKSLKEKEIIVKNAENEKEEIIKKMNQNFDEEKQKNLFFEKQLKKKEIELNKIKNNENEKEKLFKDLEKKLEEEKINYILIEKILKKKHNENQELLEKINNVQNELNELHKNKENNENKKIEQKNLKNNYYIDFSNFFVKFKINAKKSLFNLDIYSKNKLLKNSLKISNSYKFLKNQKSKKKLKICKTGGLMQKSKISKKVQWSEKKTKKQKISTNFSYINKKEEKYEIKRYQSVIAQNEGLKESFHEFNDEDLTALKCMEEFEVQKKKMTFKQITKILKTSIDNSQIVKEEKKDSFKKYSYDHLGIIKRPALLAMIKKYQGLKNIKNCFSDIVLRFNSWSKKKKKWIVITSRYFYIFNNEKKLKKAIRLNDITKLKHNVGNNYLGICTLELEEVLEIFRKEEVLIYLEKQLDKLGKDININKKIQNNQIFQPTLMEKYKPYFLETFALASKNKDIGYLTTSIRKYFGLFGGEKEYLAIITQYGIVFFESGTYDLVEFLPVVGAFIKLPANQNSPFLYIVFNDKSEKIIRFHSVLEKNEWYPKLKAVAESK